ncbi:MAG: guanylate kinase [Dehalococcoidales bacterium]|nr:guanylate kinase [Dehalococcoidales bacterium]
MGDNSPKSSRSPEFSGKPLLIVLSGPSGVGKDAVLNYLKKSSPNFKFVTTMTTRPRRFNEKNDVDYHFVSKNEFQNLLENNELLESASVYNNWYGVPKEPIRKALKQGNDIMVKVDVQGAASIKKIVPQAVFIFLMAPSREELADRLTKRYTESQTTLAVRLQAADDEIKQVSMFDYVVINHSDRIGLAVDEIKAIITAEKCRVKSRDITLP